MSGKSIIASKSLKTTRTNPIDPLAAVSLGSQTRGRRRGGTAII